MFNPTGLISSEEAALVAAVLAGNKDAFRRLIHQYERLVVAMVYKMVVQREDAEDLCQDVFLKVYEKLPSFRFGSKLSTWIGSITFNTCVSFLRKKKPVLLHDLKNPGPENEDIDGDTGLWMKDAANGPEESLLYKEREALLAKGFDRLTVIQRTILLLFHQAGMSLQEIVTVTALPLSTVKSHLFRARKQLKADMDKQLNR